MKDYRISECFIRFYRISSRIRDYRLVIGFLNVHSQQSCILTENFSSRRLSKFFEGLLDYKQRCQVDLRAACNLYPSHQTFHFSMIVKIHLKSFFLFKTARESFNKLPCCLEANLDVSLTFSNPWRIRFDDDFWPFNCLCYSAFSFDEEQFKDFSNNAKTFSFSGL